MKYAESVFAVAYLLIALLGGIAIRQRRADDVGRLMSRAVLILWFGDLFHLVPRVLGNLTAWEPGLWLDAGTMVTSLTMTVFYVMLFALWEKLYGEKHGYYSEMLVRDLSGIRALAVLIVFFAELFGNSLAELGPSAELIASLIRNVPFTIVGGIVAGRYYKKRGVIPTLRPVWLLIVLSFLFYLPVALGAAYLPILGVLMVPKTVCYILMIFCFLRYARETGADLEA